MAYGLRFVESFAEGIDAFGQTFAFDIKALLLLFVDVGSVESEKAGCNNFVGLAEGDFKVVVQRFIAASARAFRDI